MNLHTYTYDAEGNVTAIDGGSTASYTYDANNQRVEAITPAGTQEFGFNAGGQRATVWDGSGNLVSAQYGGVAYYLAADGHVRFEHDCRVPRSWTYFAHEWGVATWAHDEELERSRFARSPP